MKNNKRILNLLGGMIGSGFLLIFIGTGLSINTLNIMNSTNNSKYNNNYSVVTTVENTPASKTTQIKDTTNQEVIFLSDINYRKAQVGWGNIALDKTQSNTPITLIVNGSSTVFKKGIWAHATSTVEYDISAYKDYAYLITYYGLNTTASSTGNGAKFYIYTSIDGKNWNLKTEENPAALKGVNNAKYVKIDIKDANYIRLYAHDNGSNASDHVVWADTKLVKEDYNDNVMPTVEEYDNIIKSKYQPGVVNDDLKLTLLQRNFIKNVGQYQLRSFLENDPKNKETLNWFLNNEEALRLWTIGGKPNGTYERALQVLSDLYHTYKEDLSNENKTELGTKYKDLYLKMMLSLSLTHSTNVGLWVGGNQLSDAVTRYEIYKQMHLDKKLGSNGMFESYTIDEMRGVMITNIDDEEILWLRDYSTRYTTTAQRFNPYTYITYRTGYAYGSPKYYSAENYDKWNTKYNLSKYNITYRAGKPKLWIVFEEGAVCGGLSKTAANLYGVWGYPGRVVGQPGHAAYVYLYNYGGGKYAWQLANSVAATGWANSTGGGINGWGSKYATNTGSIKPGSYLLLSQDAQNEYDKYERAELILLQASIYNNDKTKLEQIYRDALNEEIINLDAWIGLVDLYMSDETKTDKDLYDLAEEIAETYTYHPLPMYDLTRRINTKISTSAYHSKIMMLQDKTLKKATKATSANTIYTKEVPIIANAILGVVDSKVATFSFDGANANKIVLSKQLQSAQVSWEYSLDGGDTWKEFHESSIQLTKEEVDSITAENDIKIHIIGIPRTDANIYTIDIKNGVFPSGTVSIDDYENHFNGTNEKMEWTTDLNGEWQAFSDATPLFKGDVVVYVRMIATGIYTTTSPVHYTFTTNASSLTNRFIARNKISVKSVSAGGTNNVSAMLDGNINSYWRGKESGLGGDLPASWVILELDEAKYVSELDYIPAANAKTTYGGYPTGKARALKIETSMDNTNWTTAATATNLADNATAKKITFEEPHLAKYVRITCTGINNANSLTKYFTIAVLNLYENPTVSEIPLAEVSYNITKKTNQNVVAELVNENREITVTNNGGKKTYTFEKNGEFTFEFVDNNGKKGSATAIVDWIDKTPPKMHVEFSTTEKTNQDVVVTISFDKENVTVLSDIEFDENSVPGSKIMTFSDNGSIKIEFQDELGNIGTKTITVDWIDLKAPTGEFEYSTNHLTNKSVTAKLKPSEEVIITNNGGKDTYTFEENGSYTLEFVDKAGNTGTATATVTWIVEKMPEYEIEYSTKEITNQNVNVIVTLEEGYRIINNNGSNKYTFTKNGTFEFQYINENGIIGIIPVSVDWIKKLDTTPSNKPNDSTNKTEKPNTKKPTPSKNNSTKTKKSITSQTATKKKNTKINNSITELKTRFVKLQIPSNIINGKGTLKYKKIENQKEYDSFELSLENATIKTDKQTIKMIVDLKNNKKVANVYFMDEKGNLTKLEYNQTKDNSIEVEINKLGKFVIAYQNQAEREAVTNKETKKVTNVIYAIIAVAIIAMLSITTIALKSPKKHIK